MKTFLIIDGNAIVHRAYHALPPLTNDNGKPVNAVYGFFSMLLKVIEDVKPFYLAVCFDRPAPTFRQALYASYQQHRPQMTDDLSLQIAVLHEALEKIGITIFEVDGYEADDLIGTLAAQAIQNENREEALEVKIVTGDRDLLQLVNSHVRVLCPVLGITKMVEYDEKAVEKKFGITPKQFIDYKALIGDPSDGYPGVNGIGPKTAASLLQQFGTFENLYNKVSDVPPKIAERLATDAEQAALAKKLATIALDAPIHLHRKHSSIGNIEKEKIAEVFEELSFESLKKRLASISAIKGSAERQKEKAGSQMDLL